MSCDTMGRIKGYVKHEDIFDFIKQKWDNMATDSVKKDIPIPLSRCDWKYKFNEHSEDDKNWYSIFGFIYFKYNGENRALFYNYSNLNTFENQEHYAKCGLSKMVEAETTELLIGYNDDSVAIMKEIIAHFGGGWVDENDCDNEEYYWIEGDKNE